MQTLFVDCHAGFYSFKSYMEMVEIKLLFFNWEDPYDVECMCIYRYMK